MEDNGGRDRFTWWKTIAIACTIIGAAAFLWLNVPNNADVATIRGDFKGLEERLIKRIEATTTKDDIASLKELISPLRDDIRANREDHLNHLAQHGTFGNSRSNH